MVQRTSSVRPSSDPKELAADEVLLRTGEVARFLQCDPKTVHKMCERDGLPHLVYPNGYRAFPKSWLIAWVREHIRRIV